jgi:hypothetical protein
MQKHADSPFQKSKHIKIKTDILVLFGFLIQHEPVAYDLHDVGSDPFRNLFANPARVGFRIPQNRSLYQFSGFKRVIELLYQIVAYTALSHLEDGIDGVGQAS